ncbi:unnamed protein product [Arabis nemorensis]|uniref:Uncharacterized protein n=1 Tax=Arabis nemorensis TaxID=586526 RepID=A0A565BKE4_9BRAS|nr:unnamed protein product [Arabis nemorensis]
MGLENSSEHSTIRTLTIDEQNYIFLKCTETDKKGNSFGLGQLQELEATRKRKKLYASSDSSSLVEIQEEL